MKFRWQLSTVLVAGLCFGLAGQCLAQYVWVDEKGVKQFSDQPPPPGVPKNRILKGPGAKAAPQAASGESQASAATPATAAAPASAPLSIAERNADFNKRRQEQAEKDKKQADDASRADAKRKNCGRAREFQQSLDSGTRISQFDEAGNKGFMSDDQRAQASRENKQVLAECK